METVTLADLGPVHLGEPRFSRRVRVHQAWYRAAVLGLAGYGATRPPGERPLGSILSDQDSRQRVNFLSDDSSICFDERRSKGWGIDPVRTLAYLTSSQALTLNLFAPLAAEPRWLAAVLSALAPSSPSLTSIDSVELEYFAPRPSEALGDRTTIDVLINARRGETPIVVAVETKLGDRFNSRRVATGSAYTQLHHLWHAPSIALQHETSQLARVHALAEHVSRSRNGSTEPATLLLIHHDDDPNVSRTADAYAATVKRPESFIAVPLSEFLVAMRSGSEQASEGALVTALSLRYVEHARSEPVWQEFLRAGSPKRAR